MEKIKFELSPLFDRFLKQYRRQQEGKQVLFSALSNEPGSDYEVKYSLQGNNAFVDPTFSKNKFGTRLCLGFIQGDGFLFELLPTTNTPSYNGYNVNSTVTDEEIEQDPSLAYLREDPSLKLFLIGNVSENSNRQLQEFCSPYLVDEECGNQYQLDFCDKHIKQNLYVNMLCECCNNHEQMIEGLGCEIGPNELTAHKTPEMEKIAKFNLYLINSFGGDVPLITFDREKNKYALFSFSDNWLSRGDHLLEVDKNLPLAEIVDAYRKVVIPNGLNVGPSLEDFKQWHRIELGEPYRAHEDQFQFHPKTKEELKELVDDPEVNLGEIDTTKITDMSELFKDSKRTDFSGIEKWNVSNVTSMGAMFAGCHDFNQDISSWDVSSVENMFGMFADCRAFNQSLNAWDVSKVTSMFNLFYGCEKFNQPLDMWNVSNVISMQGMFEGCKNFNQPLNNWDVSNVKDTSQMFDGCENFNQPLNYWNVSKVEDMYGMFAYCTSFNQPLNDWDVSNAKLLCDLFDHCEQFNQDLNDWVIREDCKVKGMFDGCNKQTYDNVKMIGFSKTQLQDLDPSEEENRFVKGFKEQMGLSRKEPAQEAKEQSHYVKFLH